MGEVSIPEKDKRTFILDHDELFDLYQALVAGRAAQPKSLRSFFQIRQIIQSVQMT